jgi:ATP-dependent exoDNAse (exonuclease V) beta subunit
MAVLCRSHDLIDECARELSRHRVPHQVRRRAGDFRPLEDTIKIMTMHVSKGLEFPVVALPGVGEMPSSDEDPRDEARVFYVAATRATHRLIVTTSGAGEFGALLLSK